MSKLKNKIYIVLGTKAQLIKMAPVMIELNKNDTPYWFIFTGQHQETIQELLNIFKLKKPDITLYSGKDITKISQMFFWSLKILFNTLIHKRQIFPKSSGIVLVHGDTFSTLLGALMGKIGNQKICYIEAGLRSFNLFSPFPEELIRRLVSRISDIHFCPGDFATQNSQKYQGVKINTKQNTLLDSLNLALTNKNIKVKYGIPQTNYCIFSIHRFENIFSKKQLSQIVKYIYNYQKVIKVLFILHKPTEERLKECGLYNKLLRYKNVELRPRYDYFSFIKLLNKSEFLVTDGGSNQEECYYLGKPCLLLRKTTEREEGTGKNVILSDFDKKTIEGFVENNKKYIFKIISNSPRPSKIIVSYFKN